MTKKLKLLVFLLLLAVCFFGQGKAPELLARINAKMEWHKQKAKRVFIRKMIPSDKERLREKYGHGILKKIDYYPVTIRMKFPRRFKLDTSNIYNNLNKLRFSKRRGLFQAYGA